LKAHLFFYREYQVDGSTLRKSTQKTYFPGTDLIPLETVVDYKYKSGLMPSKIVTTTSDDRTIVSEVRYPRDYSPNVSGFIADMRQRNIVNKQIESVAYEAGADGNRTISGVINNYGTGTEAGLVKNRYLLRTDRQLDWRSVDFSVALSGT